MWPVFALCAIGVVGGGLGSEPAETAEGDRHQRSPTLNIEHHINNPNDDFTSIVYKLALEVGLKNKKNHLDVETVKIPASLDFIVSNAQGQAGYKIATQVRGVDIETIKVPASLDYVIKNGGNGQEYRAPEPVKEYVPFSEGSQLFDTASQMILSYRRQRSLSPEMPAIISRSISPDRIGDLQPIQGADQGALRGLPVPPRPDFNRSLRLRVDLTVPNSDYTEAYDIEWHHPSGSVHNVVEDGTTVFYRSLLPDYRVQHLEVRTDGNSLRRCTLSPLVQASRADLMCPGLPEMNEFLFTGYTSAEGRPVVERWQRFVVGAPGGAGAAYGESLNFTHEMLVTREFGNAVPVRYTVVTDSSVVGPGSDTYIHRYRLLPPPTAPVTPDLSKVCDVYDEFQYDRRDSQEEVVSQIVSRFDPNREFTGASRDSKYNSIFGKFKQQFSRKYMNSDEDALRKTLLIKSLRFISAGNRLTTSFEMGSNFLVDRLNDEVNPMYGVEELPDNSREPGLIDFPYSSNEVQGISGQLEKEFDWRTLGGVSPVRYQDTKCASCWAFAVAGSTEGALFKKTKRLMPLSVQCLVDCGKPYGAHGCDGTWPSFGYGYVQARGLPAWDEYTPYQAKVLQCREASVPPVTHINGHVNVTANSEAALKVAIKNHAPTVVVVDGLAQSFMFYKSGVLKDKRCGANKTPTKGGGIKGLNHAVLAVGWGSADGPHFILKNTWSAKWGEAGYIRMSPDSCGVLERPSYAQIEEPNIDRGDLRAAARGRQR